MSGNGASRRRRRRIALRLLVAGGALLLIGIIVFIVGSVAVSNGGTPGGTTPTQTGSPTPTEGATPAVAAGSSPWNAANVFGGITAITGLIGALTGAATLRASRHQAPQTVYVMASQPPVAPPAAAPMSPATGPVPEPSEPKSAHAGPAVTHGTGESDQASGTTDRSDK